MATLFNTKIKDTYQSLLKLEDNTILTTTVKNVTDGLGNASPLYMSTTRIGIGTNAPISTMHIAGLSTFVGASGSTLGSTTANAAAQFYQTGFNGVLAIGGYSNGGGELQSYQSGGASLGGTIFLQRQTGNVLIGSASDTAKLSIKGSGSTSATTSLLVQNSGGTAALTVRDDLYVFGGSRVYSTGNMYMDGNSGTLFSAWGQLQLQGASYVQIMNDTLRVSSQNFTFQNASFSPNGTTNSNLRLVGNSTGFTNGGSSGTSVGNSLEIPIGIATSIGNVTLNHININGVVNTTAGTTVQRGFYYNPTLTSTVGFTHNAIETVTGNVLLGTTSGNVLIGTTTNAGEKLQVNGTVRAGSTLQLDNGAITWGNASGAPTSRLRITRRTGWGTATGIEIGALNTNTSAFASTPIVIGDLNTLGDVGTLILGTNNNVQQNATTVIGGGNSIPVVTGVTTSRQIILGDGNTANAYTNGQVPGIIVGYGNNQNGFSWSQMYGTLLKPYADGQLLFGANAGPVNPSIREVYIGYGYRNEQTSGNQDNGNGNNLLISPSNASDATDKNGGNLTLAGSRGTGAGTPGNLIFSTATTTTSGTTLQTLTERMRINGSGNVLIGTTTDSGYKLDVNGSARFSSTTIVQSTQFADSGQIFRNGGNLALQSVAGVGNNNSVCINTSPNDTDAAIAILVIKSTTKGVLFPRMTTAQKLAIVSPVGGLQVFDTTLNQMSYYNGTTWVNF